MTQERPVIISCDGHATGRPEDYIPYIEPAYRTRYEEFVREHMARQEAAARARKNDESLFAEGGSFAFSGETGNALDGEWDSSIRTRVLEGEGVVAEVLFPNGGVPFGESAEHELRAVGNSAYDRWLLDFCNETPGRRAGLAMLTVHDLDSTIEEIRWSAENGLRGVIIPTVPGKGLPPYMDTCYDPMWAACQDLEVPVHIHGGGGTPSYGDYGVVSMLMFATEASFYSQRNLWMLIWAGVLDRFPRLQVVFTEARADWVPNTLMLLDGIHSARFFRNIENTAKLKPSEYFERQVTIGASFMNSYESSIRHDIGVDHLMWGADFPHIEGTWPRTRKSLARCFNGVPAEDVRSILQDTPARVYGFDIEALQPIADEVGPSYEELVGSA